MCRTLSPGYHVDHPFKYIEQYWPAADSGFLYRLACTFKEQTTDFGEEDTRPYLACCKGSTFRFGSCGWLEGQRACEWYSQNSTNRSKSHCASRCNHGATNWLSEQPLDHTLRMIYLYVHLTGRPVNSLTKLIE